MHQDRFSVCVPSNSFMLVNEHDHTINLINDMLLELGLVKEQDKDKLKKELDFYKKGIEV